MRRSLMPIALLATFGCSELPTYAEHGAEAMDTVAIEAMFIVAAMDSMTPATMPADAAQRAADQAGEFFSDGCFTTSVDGPAVTYNMVDCTGPLGFEGVTGEVTTTYRMTTSGVGFDVVVGNLTVGDNDARFTTSGDIATDVTRVTVTSMTEIVGPRGILVGRDGSYVLRWGRSTRCAAIDGTFTTTVQRNTWETTATEWQRCPNACPSMGGSVVISGDEGTITLTYDGSPTLAWSAGADGSGTLPLICPGEG